MYYNYILSMFFVRINGGRDAWNMSFFLQYSRLYDLQESGIIILFFFVFPLPISSIKTVMVRIPALVPVFLNSSGLENRLK